MYGSFAHILGGEFGKHQFLALDSDTVTLYAAEDDRKLDREKFHSTHANSHLPNGELGGYGYNANNIYIYTYIFL